MAEEDYFRHNLLSEETSFRLIRLADTTDEDTLAFEVSEHELEFLPCFSTLSYRWGSNSSPRTILLNGKRFEIRQNLWQFLKQVQLENDRGYYWIDALCVNQADPQERNNCVMQVGQLFKSAQRVLVWLGHYKSLESCFSELMESRKSTYLCEEDDAARSIGRANLCLEILKMQYWSRVWIVPELVLSRTAVLKCLSQEVSFDYLHSYCLKYMIPQQEIWRSERAWTLLNNVTLGIAIRSMDWLFFIADQECDDPRDKAYSFFSIYCYRFGRFKLSSSPDVDYRKSVETVYWDLAYTMLLNSKTHSYEGVKLGALDVRLWIEKVLGLTPIENVRDIDVSYLSLLQNYLLDESISSERRALAEITYTASIALGLAWSAALHQLPFRSFIFVCGEVHVDTDRQGSVMLVPSDHASRINTYEYVTNLAQQRASAEWQCTSCFRIIGDFFISDNQLRNEDTDRVRLDRINKKGKRKVMNHSWLTTRPWHEYVVNCADCSFVEYTIVKHLRAACDKRDWDAIPRVPTGESSEDPAPSDGYDTTFSFAENYLYYQASEEASSAIVLWIEAGSKLSKVKILDDPQAEKRQESFASDLGYIWFFARAPQSRNGCWLRTGSPRNFPVADLGWTIADQEHQETMFAENPNSSVEGTDGSVSPLSEKAFAEHFADEEEPSKAEAEGLSVEAEGESLPVEAKVLFPVETNENVENGKTETTTAEPSQNFPELAGDPSSLSQDQAANAEEGAMLYDSSLIAWLTIPPPKPPSMPMPPLPRKQPSLPMQPLPRKQPRHPTHFTPSKLVP